jgi:chemotaxis protein histidine kinase CheA
MANKKAAEIKVETFADYQVITQPNPLRKLVRRVDDKDKDDPVARAEKALAGLSGEFKGWMLVECERLSAAHAAIKVDGMNAQNREELFRAAHDIKGDAATFGYPTAAAAAESLCRIIEHSPDLISVPEELIAHHVNAIHAIFREQSRIEAVGMADELSRRLRSLADEYLIAVNKDRPEHLEAILSPSISPAE